MTEAVASVQWSQVEHVGSAGECALAPYSQVVAELIQIGKEFHARGWSLATSSNYSVVVSRNPLVVLITASGKDKSRLTPQDFVLIDDQGRPLHSGQPRASAETLLHVVAAKRPRIGAVLHTHSVWATVLSDVFYEQGGVRIEGYEMLKGLDGITTHETYVWLPILNNSQDIPTLAAHVDQLWDDARSPLRYGYLIRGHGLYTWGRDLHEARRHVEAIEFLLECVAHRTLAVASRPRWLA
jgi:methylthioribulose-1-phosphate dehydratase